MTDKTTTLEQLKAMAQKFVADRDWTQYHSPKNLSMNLSIEVAELMEKFLWLTTQESIEELERNRQEIEDEMGDILLSVFCFANSAKIDLAKVFGHKLAKVVEKYPVEKAKGKRVKYTELK